MRYTIAPFKWKLTKTTYSEEYNCSNSFGRYYVSRVRENLEDSGQWESWKWGYCFDEYHDEDYFECTSAKEGKIKAWENWLERLKPSLIEIKKGE